MGSRKGTTPGRSNDRSPRHPFDQGCDRWSFRWCWFSGWLACLVRLSLFTWLACFVCSCLFSGLRTSFLLLEVIDYRNGYWSLKLNIPTFCAWCWCWQSIQKYLLAWFGWNIPRIGMENNFHKPIMFHKCFASFWAWHLLLALRAPSWQQYWANTGQRMQSYDVWRLKTIWTPTMWGPPVISWFISTSNYSYNML